MKDFLNKKLVRSFIICLHILSIWVVRNAPELDTEKDRELQHFQQYRPRPATPRQIGLITLRSTDSAVERKT